MDFPALTPAERRYSAGEFKASRRSDLSGAMVRFLRGRAATGHRLSLPFPLATTAEARAILDHYRTVQGTFVPFELPAETWCGSDNPLELKWRYAGPPEVQDLSPGYFSVTVELISITTELPARAVSAPIASTTEELIAQTAPVAPDDPFGTFIKCPAGTVQVEVGGSLAIPNRTIQAVNGAPIEVLTTAVLNRPRFIPITGEAPAGSVQVGSGVETLVVDQRNWKTVLAELLRLGLSETDTPVGVVYQEDDFDLANEGGVVSMPLGGLETMGEAPVDSAPVYVRDPTPDVFSYAVSGQTISGVILFELAVGSSIDLLSRAAVGVLISSIEAAVTPVDLLLQDALAVAIPLDLTVGNDGDMPRCDSLEVGFGLGMSVSAADPAYVDFTSADPDEDAAFYEGGIVVDGLIATVDTPASGDPDTPRRGAAGTDVIFTASVGSVIDAPIRASSGITISDLTLTLATLTEPTFSDLTP